MENESIKERLFKASDELTKLLEEYAKKESKYKIGDIVFYHTYNMCTNIFTNIGKITNVHKSVKYKDIKKEGITYVIEPINQTNEYDEVYECDIIKILDKEDSERFILKSNEKKEQEEKLYELCDEYDLMLKEYQDLNNMKCD